MSKREYQKQYREQNREKLKEYNKLYQREYFKKNPHFYIFWQAKQRARKLGLLFDISPDDCVAPEFCPILGLRLERNVGGRKPLPSSPSLDRIVPELGYTKGNVQVISQRANAMKNDASMEELKRFAEWINKSIL